MSRRSLDQGVLRAILAVRQVQRDLAESRYRKAGLDVRDAEHAENMALQRLNEAEAKWLLSLKSGDFTTVPLWSQALEQKDRDLKATAEQRRETEQAYERTASAWHVAMAHTDLAERALAKAQKSAAREIEDARALDIADRYAFGGRRR